MTQEALKLALEALEADELDMVDDGSGNMVFRKEQAITAIEEALAQPEQEPVEIDQATMELAESVGLIGPTSRTHDLHQAIQRFHDLICVNATVKAAQMAADVIRESTPPQHIEPVIDQSAAIRIATTLGWTPPRPWVGLTDEEFHDLQIENIDDPWANFKAIEAKLKQKNGYAEEKNT